MWLEGMIILKDIFNKNYEVIEGELICPHCEKTMTLEQVLENASVSWPGLDWILLKCPICNHYMHVEVINEQIRTGVLQGAPGPVFIPCSMVKGIDLITNTTNEYIECVYNDMKYRFIAK
jgi:uncharacterized protein YbaR (Trm112 family)